MSENGLAALQVYLNEVHVELFASKEQHMMQLYCLRYPKNAYCCYWNSMGLCYASPPFSQLAKVLTKIAYEGARVVSVYPRLGYHRRTRLLETTVGPYDIGKYRTPQWSNLRH